MRVTVELQAYLEQYAPNASAVFEYDLPEGASVHDLTRKLGVPEELANVIVIGNSTADFSQPLHEGDRITIIPPLAGG